MLARRSGLTFQNPVTCHAMTQRYKILHASLPDLETLVNSMLETNQNWVPLGPVVKDKNDLWVQTMVRLGHGAGRYDRIIGRLRGSSLD